MTWTQINVVALAVLLVGCATGRPVPNATTKPSPSPGTRRSASNLEGCPAPEKPLRIDTPGRPLSKDEVTAILAVVADSQVPVTLIREIDAGTPPVSTAASSLRPEFAVEVRMGSGDPCLELGTTLVWFVGLVDGRWRRLRGGSTIHY